MATMKINWALPTTGSMTRKRAIFLNGEMVASTDKAEVKALASAAGAKNTAPFHLNAEAKSLTGITVETKAGDNQVEVRQANMKGEYALISKASSSFTSADKIKVKVKKRGLILGLILGSFNVSVKTK